MGVAGIRVDCILLEDGCVVREIPQLTEGVQRPRKANLVVVVLLLAILEAKLHAMSVKRPAEGVAETIRVLRKYAGRIFSLRRSKPDPLTALEYVLDLDIWNTPIHDSLIAGHFVVREPAEIQPHFVQLSRRNDPVP